VNDITDSKTLAHQLESSYLHGRHDFRRWQELQSLPDQGSRGFGLGFGRRLDRG
jgi:hypothetical protein